MMKLLSSAMFVTIFLCGLLNAQTSQTKPIDPVNIDPSVQPTQDFFQYANGGWIKNNPIPSDQSSWGSFQELRDKSLYAMRSILEEAAQKTSAPWSEGMGKGSNEQKMGDFWFSGMDSVAIEAQGAKPLDEEMNAIKNMRSTADLQKELARLQTLNIGAPFGFGSGQDFKNSSAVIVQIGQGGLSLPERDYYLNPDEDSLRHQYTDHVAKMFVLLGDDPGVAKAEADTVLDFETELARASLTNVEMRDIETLYNKMTVAQVNALTPDFSWTGFFANVGLKNPGDVNVLTPGFFKQMNAMITSEPLASWKTYLRWHVINGSARFLSTPFVMEDFRFKGQILSGQKEIKARWKRVVASADGSLGEALGQLYVAKYFPPEAKTRAKEMINNLIAALHDKINHLAWMSDETKKQANKKLDMFTVKVGYPDKWRDYSSLEIDRGPFALNMLRVARFDFQYDLDKIGKPVDKMEWTMTPPTVNAYYNPLHNEIVFPAGIMQPPFFDPKADDAVNYGGMGGAIGHEMSHGFDDQGRTFDGDGNMKNWWTSDDSAKYMAAAQRITDQFNGYVAIDTFHVNGKLTLGEDIGDFGGLTISYAAFKKAQEGKPQEKIDGFTPDQRFFLAWAQVWRGKYKDAALKQLVKTNPHAPGRFRVNGPLSNMPEFFEAFSVKEGDPMMRPADERPKIW